MSDEERMYYCWNCDWSGLDRPDCCPNCGSKDIDVID